MDSSDESNSPSLFHGYSRPVVNRSSRSSVEGCLSQVDPTEVCIREGKEENSKKEERKVNFQSVPRLPEVAVQEKIIFCIENTREKGEGYSYKDLDQNSSKPNTYAIRNEAIRLFLTNKLAIAKDTEFCIAAVEPGNIKWLSHLSSDIHHLVKSLVEYRYVTEEIDDLNVTPVFSNVLNVADLTEQTNINIIPPSYIVRVIFIYNSSYVVPKVNIRDPSYLKFMMSPFCFLDVFYLHEKQSDCNNVEQIFKDLSKIVAPFSYLLESSRDITKIFNTSAKLLAHPNQRVIESAWNF